MAPIIARVSLGNTLAARQSYGDTESDKPPVDQNRLVAIIIFGIVIPVLILVYTLWRCARNNSKAAKLLEENRLLDQNRKEDGEEFRKPEMDGEGIRKEGEELQGKPIEVRYATDQILELDAGEAGRELECRPVPGSVRDV